MTTETITLSSFLLARIAEDEAAARAIGDRWERAVDVAEWWGELAAYADRHDPARVLAECAAKRAIVELHAAYPTLQVMVYGTIAACSECGSVDDSPVEWPCPTLRTLAAVYAGSPEFREEWRP